MKARVAFTKFSDLSIAFVTLLSGTVLTQKHSVFERSTDHTKPLSICLTQVSGICCEDEIC